MADVDFKDGFADDADFEAALDLDFFKVIPQIHQDTPTEEPDETPSNPYQQVDSESDLNATAETEHYTEVEEEDVELTTVQETSQILETHRNKMTQQTKARGDLQRLKPNPVPQLNLLKKPRPNNNRNQKLLLKPVNRSNRPSPLKSSL